jgi:hypothetical protein
MNYHQSAWTRLVIISALLLSSNAVFAQCTTTAWSSVTGNPEAIGVDTNPEGKRYEQNCGLTIDLGDAPSYVTSTEPSNESTFSARFYLLPEALDLSTGHLTLLTAEGGQIEFMLLIRSTGMVNHLVPAFRDDDSLVEVSQDDWIALQDVWQAVEVAWSAGSGDGTFEVRVDDIPVFSLSSLQNSGAVIDAVDIGVINTPDATGELVLDAIELRRAGESGLLDITELRNISTRADVRIGDERVIGGFIIEGDTDKCVVIRGRGPSVDVPEGIRLQDPKLDLKSGATTIASNNNWQDDPVQADIIANLGLEPGNPLDSAIHTCLPPGPYTAILAATGIDKTGVGIVEVYDADVGTPFLGNISTRAPVDAGDLRAIGGFIVEGIEPKQVLVRARGPSLGLGEIALSNPRVRLFDSGGEIGINDNWGDALNAGAISDTGLAPSDALESAILMTLDPGPYTAIVNAVSGPGIGIVEVYDLSGAVIAPQ